MLFEVLADKLPHYLRGRQVLCGAEFFERLFLDRVDQDGQSGTFRFHGGSAIRYVNQIIIDRPLPTHPEIATANVQCSRRPTTAEKKLRNCSSQVSVFNITSAASV